VFWVKAQLGFGRTGDGDASGATFLLGGVVVEPHASCRQHQILGESLALQVVRPATMASMVIPLGVTPFMKASLKNLWLVTCPPAVADIRGSSAASAFGGVPRCACVCLCSTRNGLSYRF
jgi:hypothetical protein